MLHWKPQIFSQIKDKPTHETCKAMQHLIASSKLNKIFDILQRTQLIIYRTRSWNGDCQESRIICPSNVDARRCESDPLQVTSETIFLVVDIRRSLDDVHKSNRDGDDRLFLLSKEGDGCSSQG